MNDDFLDNNRKAGRTVRMGFRWSPFTSRKLLPEPFQLKQALELRKLGLKPLHVWKDINHAPNINTSRAKATKQISAINSLTRLAIMGRLPGA